MNRQNSTPKQASKQGQKPVQRSLSSNRPIALQLQKRQSNYSSAMITQLHHPNQEPLSQAPQPSSASVLSKPSQLSSKVQELISLFRISQIPTRSYREVIEQIAQSFTTMDSLTTHLEQKVDNMLKNQQQQFIESYKTHMKKIQEEFQSVDKKIEQYQNKIAYYENQGEMSQLFIKVNKLEEQCRKLYKDLTLKEKVNKDFELTIKVQKSEIKRYQKELKLLLREKSELLLKVKELKDQLNQNNKKDDIDLQQNVQIKDLKINQNSSLIEKEDLRIALKQLESIQSTQNVLFPTQFEIVNKIDKIDIKNPNDLSTEYHFGSHHSGSRQHLGDKRSLKSLTLDLSLDKASPSSLQQTPLVAKVRQMQLKREVQSLKKKNQMLNSFQSYVLQAKTDMESFFTECVNQIKQQIKIRKKINFCTFEEWKKEDKIELLIKIISNDDILAHLYERIFKKKRLFGTTTKDQTKQKSLLELPKNDITTIHPRRFEPYSHKKNASIEEKEKSFDYKKDEKHQKVLSVAKRRFSKHISENSLLPKIHFHLEY